MSDEAPVQRGHFTVQLRISPDPEAALDCVLLSSPEPLRLEEVVAWTNWTSGPSAGTLLLTAPDNSTFEVHSGVGQPIPPIASASPNTTFLLRVGPPSQTRPTNQTLTLHVEFIQTAGPPLTRLRPIACASLVRAT